MNHDIVRSEDSDRLPVFPQCGYMRAKVDDSSPFDCAVGKTNGVREPDVLGETDEMTSQLRWIAPREPEATPTPGVDKEVGAVVPHACVRTVQISTSEESCPEDVGQAELL